MVQFLKSLDNQIIGWMAPFLVKSTEIIGQLYEMADRYLGLDPTAFAIAFFVLFFLIGAVLVLTLLYLVKIVYRDLSFSIRNFFNRGNSSEDEPELLLIDEFFGEPAGIDGIFGQARKDYLESLLAHLTAFNGLLKDAKKNILDLDIDKQASLLNRWVILEAGLIEQIRLYFSDLHVKKNIIPDFPVIVIDDAVLLMDKLIQVFDGNNTKIIELKAGFESVFQELIVLNKSAVLCSKKNLAKKCNSAGFASNAGSNLNFAAELPVTS